VGKPLAIDLYAGLGGWGEGLMACGWNVIGFDIKRHDYGTGVYPGQLVLQDVLTLHGSQFRNASLIVASPPCQVYSYRAMPWKRAKALPPPANTLFDGCFRIQREACAAAARHIPMVVENVKGAQKWVGRAAWHFGSYYLWGDVPAIMPNARVQSESVKTVWHINKRDSHSHTRHLTNALESDAVKQAGLSGPKWFNEGAAAYSSGSSSRKTRSAMIAKIPFALANWIGKVYYPK
jgi:C-5 cytosine-specific DNA methylase